MSMFCYQCQETLNCNGCTQAGACGKKESTANLQDLLMFVNKGIALLALQVEKDDELFHTAGRFLMNSMFATITNANFDDGRFYELINQALALRTTLKEKYGAKVNSSHESLTWLPKDQSEFSNKAKQVGVLSTENEDVRSLRELLIYGIKGISAYASHAHVLKYESDNIYRFMMEGLSSTTKDESIDRMVSLVLKAGEIAVETMALLDKANTSTYGSPEITNVNIGVGNRPGILISGHDLKDMKDLLEQSKNSGIDIYTHSEMLPAHYYPEFKKYKHLVGNYGNAWWKQAEEFEKFNGPILMTTNCIVPVRKSYKDRIYTTGIAGYAEVPHINEINGHKDFSQIIKQAQKSLPPEEIESGNLIGGFAHNQVMALAPQIVEAIKNGSIKKFVVMGGCDGRHREREYFTKLAQELPNNTVILTAGCAKYRYNKLQLGDIGGIPRVLDAGQCNDCYSLAVIALKLQEAFGLDNINKLPIEFDIAWYEQKAVAVLLGLLHLGIKGIRLGPTLPAFLSENVVKVLVENFDIKKTDSVENDLRSITA